MVFRLLLRFAGNLSLITWSTGSAVSLPSSLPAGLVVTSSGFPLMFRAAASSAFVWANFCLVRVAEDLNTRKTDFFYPLKFQYVVRWLMMMRRRSREKQWVVNATIVTALTESYL